MATTPPPWWLRPERTANIAHQAVVTGHSVLFLTAAQMLLDLGAQESTRSLDRRLRFYASISLLVLDEVGYLSFDARNAEGADPTKRP